jgi:hypothetical protein
MSTASNVMLKIACVWLITALSAPPAAAKSGKIYPHSPCGKRLMGAKWPGCLKKFHPKELKPYTPKTYADNGLKDTLTPLGRSARGMWITPYAMYRLGAEKIARAMKRNHLNAVVLDTKDDFGQILWPSKVPLAQQQQRLLLKDPKKTIETFHKHGIYVIGRLTCFKDSRLPYLRPDLSARIGRRGRRLLSAGANWLDNYAMEVQDYLIDLALELQELGFDEIQLDYIRFPKGVVSRVGTWMHNTKGVERATLIKSFLERMDRALKIPMSADTYGLTTLVDGDPRGLGQSLEMMSKYVEALSPMMYANGMSSYFKNNKITNFVYGIIRCGLWRTRRKAPGIALRPYLQGYPNSVEHLFGPDFIKRQLHAAELAGSDGFLFWNPSMKNRVLYAGLRRLGHRKVDAYGKKTLEYRKTGPGPFCRLKGNVFGRKRKRTRKRKRAR